MILERFPEHLTLADEIARGAFCVIKRCINLNNHSEFSTKVIDLEQLATTTGLTEEDVEREVSICLKLRHPHVVELLSAYIQEDHVYMVTELMDGADLCIEIVNRVNDGFVYSEAVASHYIKQVFEALAYCHSQGIVHRDLKPQNIQLASKDDAAPVKLVDFSIAIELPPEGMITSGRIGTPHYMSPEVVNRKFYGTAVDMWSCGVVLYILLSGNFPFNGCGEKIFKVISTGDYQMVDKEWQCISEKAKTLIKALLEYDAYKRITAEEALNHPWLKDRDRFAERHHLPETVEELKKFNSRRKLKGAFYAALASRKMTATDCGGMNNRNSVNKDSTSMQLNMSIPVMPRDESRAANEDEIHEIEAVSQLSDALDNINTLTGGNKEDVDFLQSLLLNTKLKALLQVYNLAQKTTEECPIPELVGNAVTCRHEVMSALDVLDDPDESCKALRDILTKPDVRAMMEAHDISISELQGTNENLNLGMAPLDMTESVAENLTRVRLVHFTKNNNEPMGITLKLNEDKHCVVARIIHGGMIHRQGTLHVGDEIREINGLDVAKKSVEKLQAVLREATGDVTFKIVPSLLGEEIEKKEQHVRCMYDYDPRSDDLIPCQQAGMKFECGDILEIVSKTDRHWWQARKEGEKQVAGLIPSPELQEVRVKSSVSEKSKKDSDVKCFWTRKKKPKSKETKYLARRNTAFDKLELLTYEEVAFTPKFRRKSLVLIGAHGVGRRHIKNSLISHFPEKYAYPIAHTSRKPSSEDVDGQNWYFVSVEEMMSDISQNRFLEYGRHEGDMYGTKLDTVRDVINSGLMAVLDVEPPALKYLRCAEFSPYIVFISSPPSFPHSGDPKMDDSLQKLVKGSEELRSKYRHYFDYVIVNNAIEETVDELIKQMENLYSQPQWVSSSWLL